MGEKYGLNVKLGKIINLKHKYGSKIYLKNQVILDYFYAKHKCLSNILILVIDSHKLKLSVFFFFFFFLGGGGGGGGGEDMQLGKKVAIFHWEWGRNSAPHVWQTKPSSSA